jgi:hypothetical protein
MLNLPCVIFGPDGRIDFFPTHFNRSSMFEAECFLYILQTPEAYAAAWNTLKVPAFTTYSALTVLF